MRRFSLTITAVAYLALGGCAVMPIAAHPPLFFVRDADTTIWILGTIHVLPNAVDWQTAGVRAAIAGADTLVTELPRIDPDAAAATFDAAATATALPPILDRVAAARRAALATAITAAGLSRDRLDGMKTWAAALALSAGLLGADGASADPAPEAVLARAFAHKHRLAFEKLAGQFALFDALSAADQSALMDEAIGARASYQITLTAWTRGDMAALAGTMRPLADRAPALQTALVVDRNSRWSGWIARRMTRPGKLLIAVGAGHLAGPRSVIAMLRARGLTVERVR